MRPAKAAIQTGKDERTLIQVLDQLAKDHPNDTWWKVPKDPELAHGWRDITYAELAQAVDGMSKWVFATLVMGNKGNDIAAYIGINDVRYTVVQLGLVKTGHMVMLPSPRNSPDGQASLFNVTGCSCVLYSEGVDVHVNSIRDAVPDVRSFQIPSFEDLLEKGSLAAPYQGPYKDQKDDRIIVTHTSGSSGIPKPIFHTNGSISTFARKGVHRTPEGRHNVREILTKTEHLMFAFAPGFHMMGCVIIWTSILCRRPVCSPPPEVQPTPEVLIKAIEQTKPYVVMAPPSTLEDIADTPGGVESFKNVKFVMYGGGPLAQRPGSKINKVTRVLSGMGSTEAGIVDAYVPEDPADWSFFEWAAGAGAHMEPQDDGLYELVIKPDDLDIQAIWHTFPDIDVWHTRDLFERHPTKDYLWRCKGRKDDVLVLSNGEKFNPVTMEQQLESQPLIKGALVVGHARFQTGLIIEPQWTKLNGSDDPADLVESLWPAIVEANAENPGHGKVWKSKVAIAKKDKPFKRAPKGSVIRRQTTELYAAEIDALYSNEASDDTVGRLSSDADVSTTKAFLRKVFAAKDMTFIDELSDDEDIFNHGVDSLQAMALSSTLSHAVGRTVSPREIYGHPTIASLAAHLSGTKEEVNGNGVGTSREDLMAAIIQKYTHDLPSRSTGGSMQLPEKYTVILTGSTGSMGQHILEELINASHVEHIYALNRSEDAESRQSHGFQARSVAPDFSKVTFLTTNFSQERFGLDDSVYERLLQTVHIFIHNAWAVDFNKSLQTYEEVHIAGTRRCVDFTLHSRHNTHIVFVATVATITNWRASHPNDAMVPERLPEDHSAPGPGGYGEGKHVASMILAEAAQRASVPVTIVRPGQLAGSVISKAEWNRHEWLPSLIISSKALGMLPGSLEAQNLIDWVPMDLAAKSLVEIAETRAKASHAGSNLLGIAHLVNPSRTTWDTLVPVVQRQLSAETGKSIRLVSLQEWIAALASSPHTPEEIAAKPGLKLLEFFQSLTMANGAYLELETREAQAMSTTIRTMEAVNGSLMEKWLVEWEK